ncbi:MAG: hypothetical protein JO119_11350 [Acidobacteria bacterium]|nr:hypothetical protein [Acidobacteriota bacterium]
MASLKTILARTFFWSYERGTWQYDLAVIVILIFVLGTPPRWFHDQPQVGLPTSPTQVELVAGGESDPQQTYRIDARVLAPPEQTPALQNDLHNALKKALPKLRDGRFSILKIDPVRDEDGNVIAYQVEIRR